MNPHVVGLKKSELIWRLSHAPAASQSMANELADGMSDLDHDTVNARIADWHQKLTRTRNMYLERNMYIDGLTKR